MDPKMLSKLGGAGNMMEMMKQMYQARCATKNLTSVVDRSDAVCILVDFWKRAWVHENANFAELSRHGKCLLES